MRTPVAIAGIADRLRELKGWRRAAAALLAGALCNLAMAPFFAWPVLWLTFPALVWLADGAIADSPAPDAASPPRWRAWLRTRPGRAAGVGWWFGFGYFLFGLFWIGEAFLVEADVFGWLLPFAVTGMPAGLALFFAGALAAVASARLWDEIPTRIVALAMALAVAEWLRGHVLTGFPWNVLGYALTAPDVFMQSAALFGIYGLTLIAVVTFAGPLVLWAAAQHRRVSAIATGVVPIALAFVWGIYALRTPVPETGLQVRMVQPSIPQREKWRPENQQAIFNDHLDLSRRAANGGVDDLAGIDLLVWPEAAMPFLPLETPQALDAIAALLPPATTLLTGALRRERADPARGTSQRVFNSLLAFGDGGRHLATYDKLHLVPFGEYLPAQTVLEAIGLRQLTRLRGGFATGPSPRPLLDVPTRLGPRKLGPLICYEAIFPASVVSGSERPTALINVTNDGWFGNTTGPRQHFHQTRVRAVEEGLAIVRVANNGISAVIDPRGRVRQRLDLDVRGSADAALPAALPPPLYARFGDKMLLALLVLSAGILAWFLRLTPSRR